MAQTVKWGGHLVQIWSGEPLLELFRESTMADRAPDQVLGCSCFQDQKVNQFEGWVSRGQCTRSRLHSRYFTSQQIVSFSLHRDLFVAIFSIHKWTQFALTLYMFVSIPRGDLDGALFWETRRSRYEIPMVKISLPGYWNVISRTSQIQFQARYGGKRHNFVDKLDPIWERPFTTRITLSWLGSKNFPENIFFLEKRNGHRSGQPFMCGQKETY